MRIHLLLVEPDESVRTSLAAGCEEAGLRVDAVADTSTALARAAVTPYDAIAVARDSRPIPGFEVCRRLRAAPLTAEVPLLVLSAHDDPIDRVVTFEVGADDYVLKPFSARELALRVRARLRRRDARGAEPEVIRAGEVEIHPVSFAVRVGGNRVTLTPNEFAVLKALARRGGGVVTRDALLREVWVMPEPDEARTLDRHIRRLREKLGPAGRQVQTVRGVGFRLVGEGVEVGGG